MHLLLSYLSERVTGHEPRADDCPSIATMWHPLLERFVTTFDRASALAARADDQDQGRWTRAFRAVDMAHDLAMTRAELARVGAALSLALTRPNPSCGVLRDWRADWDVLLRAEGLDADEICALQWRLVGALFNETIAPRHMLHALQN